MEMTLDSSAHNQLQLPAEQMRRLGYRIVDMLVEQEQQLRDQPVVGLTDWTSAREKFGQPFPEEGLEPEAVLEKLERDVFPDRMRVNHPRFFAFVPSPGNFVGAMAEALAAGFNVFVGTWMGGSAAAALELATIDWLRQVCGLPETTQGLFVSGGSVANLTALAVARRVKLGDDTRGAVAYYSDQTHSSVERALRVLGFAADQIRRLPADDQYRLSMNDLQRQVAADRAAGRVPF